MAILAVLKLGDEYRRLVWAADTKGAIDLKLRYDEMPGNLPCVDLRPSGFSPLCQYE